MTDPLKMAVMCYGAAMLPRLRAMTRDERTRMLKEADRVSETVPIHMHPEKTLRVPLWSSEPLSGGQVTALLVFGLWVQCNEDEVIAAPVVESWPIKEALLMCDVLGEKRVAASGREMPSVIP